MAMDRRGFLGTLALAPAALAACTAAGGAAKDARRAAAAPLAPAGPRARPERGLAALRAFALPAEAEPAFTFRAAPVRSGGA